jgi:hypothetical protein
VSAKNKYDDERIRRKFFLDYALEKEFDPLVTENWYPVPVMRDLFNRKVNLIYIMVFFFFFFWYNTITLGSKIDSTLLQGKLCQSPCCSVSRTQFAQVTLLCSDEFL